MGPTRRWKKRSLTNKPRKPVRRFKTRAGRRARLRLLALLAATAAFAGLVLVVKYQMEGVRARVEALASERTGSNFTLGQVRVTGLRGVEVQGLKANIVNEDGAAVRLDVPKAVLYVDLIDLVSGRINIEQVRMDGASLVVSRAEGGAWLTPGEDTSPAPLPASVESQPGEAQAETPAPTDNQPEPESSLNTSPAVESAPTEAEEILPAPENAEEAPPASESETVVQVQPLPEPLVGNTAGGESAPPEFPGATLASLRPEAAGIFGAIERILPTFPFRVVGDQCSVRVENVVGETSISLTDLRIDAYRLSDAPDVSASISGLLDDVEPRRVEVRARYASSKDFDIRISHDRLTPGDVNIFLPAEQHVFEQGQFRPEIRLSGFPSDTLVLSVEAPYERVRFRGQPEFLPELTGRLSVVAQYDMNRQVIEITTARATSPEFAGALSGSISFANEAPEFALELQAEQLPIRDILNNFLTDEVGRFGVANLSLGSAHALALSLHGTPNAPVFSARAELDSGELTLEPENAALPRGVIQLGRVNVSWDSATGTPRGCIVVQGGAPEHKAYGVKLEQLSGTVCIEPEAVVLEPFTAMVTGNPVQGTVRYDLAKQQAEFSVSGGIANLESTPLANPVKELTLAGSAGLRATGTASLAGASIDCFVDLTQANVGFEWWIDKPVGVGALFHAVHVDFKPRKSISISGNLTLDTSEFNAVVEVLWRKGKFELERIRSKSPRIDVGTADRVLRIPYRISGGGVTEARFDWDREPSMEKANRFTLAGVIDEVSFLAKTTQVPVLVRGATVVAEIASLAETQSKLTVVAKEAYLPPFSEEWLIPLESESPPELTEKFKATKPNFWTYDLKAASLDLPPWKGTNFEGLARDDANEFNMERFSAQVGDGTLSGSYRLRDTDRVGTLSAQWQNIPASFLLRHLDLPAVLSGPCTGEVSYTMDQDDPATLAGQGRFEVAGGQFSADYLIGQLQGTLQGDVSALPPSLAFTRVGSDIQMQGDRITSDALYLDGDGIRITGSGNYIVNGDMDYNIQVSLTPETAARIPVLQTYFNIEGHRLTQNELTLGFRISGPAFQPRSQVAGLPPVGITLVSGAFEMTSEALKIVDLPRQLLVDLFKIGGGIVGAQR